MISARFAADLTAKLCKEVSPVTTVSCRMRGRHWQAVMQVDMAEDRGIVNDPLLMWFIGFGSAKDAKEREDRKEV